MTFWTFLDRNWPWVVLPIAMIVIGVADCVGERHVSTSGCGVRIDIGSKPSGDGGAP